MYGPRLGLLQRTEQRTGQTRDVRVRDVEILIGIAAAVIECVRGGQQGMQVGSIIEQCTGRGQIADILRRGIQHGGNKRGVYGIRIGGHIIHAHADGIEAAVGIAVIQCLHFSCKVLTGQNGVVGDLVHAHVRLRTVACNTDRAVADRTRSDDGVAVVRGRPCRLAVGHKDDDRCAVIGLSACGVGSVRLVAEHLIRGGDAGLRIGAARYRHRVSGVAASVAQRCQRSRAA